MLRYGSIVKVPGGTMYGFVNIVNSKICQVVWNTEEAAKWHFIKDLVKVRARNLTWQISERGGYELRPKYKWYSKAMGNIVETFGEVIRQAWDNLIHHHTIDIRWEYNKNGF